MEEGRGPPLAVLGGPIAYSRYSAALQGLCKAPPEEDRFAFSQHSAALGRTPAVLNGVLKGYSRGTLWVIRGY
jgi:hypothetical protein